jgi:diacylglycerol kinase (ATP)
MQRRFIYFINPISGTKSKDDLLKLIGKKTTQQHIPFQILHTNKEGDYNFLISKIEEEKITDIIICGGDGTVNQVAASLLNIKINIGIIPMGSGNGLALAAGIKRDPHKALDIIFAGKATAIDSFYINKKFSCMLCGLGFDAQVAHDFAAQPSRGLATYIKQTVKNFFKAEAYTFKVEANNTTINSEAFFISIANSNQFGNNFTIAPKASLSDGFLDIVIVNKMSKLKMVYTVLKQVRLGKVKPVAEKKHQESSIQYFQTKKLVIHNPSSALLHIDGDPCPTAKHFEIEVIEKAFRLLQPE